MMHRKEVSDEFLRLVSESVKCCKDVKEGEEYYCTMIYDSREPDEHWLYLNSDRTYLDQIFRSEYSPKEFRMKTVDSDKLRVGDLVVARWTKDLLLYRAKIDKKIGDCKENVKVRFVDYGNSGEVSRKSLFYYHDELNKIPFQAFTYDLIGSSKSRKSDIFKRIAMMNSLRCRIESLDMQRNPQAYITVIYDEEPSGQVTHQNAEIEVNPIILEKVKEWMNKHDFSSEEKSSISEDEYYTDVNESLDLGNDLFNFPDRQSTSNSSVYMSVANFSPNDQNYDHGFNTHIVNHRDEIFLDFLFPDMNGVFQSSLFLSAEHFYMVELSSLKTMEQIELILRSSDNSVPNRGQIVLNSCWGLRVEQDYKRVRVISTDQHSVSVKIIDSGFDITANVDDLFWLPEGLPSETPALALPCSLPSLTEFTKKANDFIEQLIAQPVNVSILQFLESDTFLVEIELDHGENLLRLLENIGLMPSSVQRTVDDEICQDVLTESDDWSYMSDDYHARTNTLDTKDDDVEVALLGYSRTEDVCQKYLLYEHCPKGDFCDKKHKLGDDDESKSFNVTHRQPQQIKLNQMLKVHVVDKSNVPVVTVRQSSVTYLSITYTLQRIEEMIGSAENCRLVRVLQVEDGKIIGIQLPEYGWVRAKIIQCVEYGHKDTMMLYLVDYGITLECTPNASQLKELSGRLQDIPFFALDCLIMGWLDGPEICGSKIDKFLEGHFDEEVMIRVIDRAENVVVQLYRKVDTSWIPLS